MLSFFISFFIIVCYNCYFFQDVAITDCIGNIHKYDRELNTLNKLLFTSVLNVIHVIHTCEKVCMCVCLRVRNTHTQRKQCGSSCCDTHCYILEYWHSCLVKMFEIFVMQRCYVNSSYSDIRRNVSVSVSVCKCCHSTKYVALLVGLYLKYKINRNKSGSALSRGWPLLLAIARTLLKLPLGLWIL